MKKLNLADKFSQFSEQWQPKIIGELDNYDIKIARIQGEFDWHSHADTDELFLIVNGEMTMGLRDGDVDLRAGEIYVVPKGVEHKPYAEKECQILMLERKGTLNTGEAESDRTVQAQRL